MKTTRTGGKQPVLSFTIGICWHECIVGSNYYRLGSDVVYYMTWYDREPIVHGESVIVTGVLHTWQWRVVVHVRRTEVFTTHTCLSNKVVYLLHTNFKTKYDSWVFSHDSLFQLHDSLNTRLSDSCRMLSPSATTLKVFIFLHKARLSGCHTRKPGNLYQDDLS